MQNRFVKVCLSLIVILLSVIAVRPFLQPGSAHAAGPVEYRVLPVNRELATNQSACQNFLNVEGKDGWLLVAVPQDGQGFYIFRR